MKNFVLVITGPAGSGKSTVANKLTRQFERCVNIEADHVKHFIVSGFKKKNKPSGEDDWEYTEWELAGDSIGLLAHNFQEKGYNVVINGYIGEAGWKAIEEHVTITHKVLLLPQVETVKARDRQRPGDEPMGEEAVQQHYDYFSSSQFYDDFVRIDSTIHSKEETAEAVAELLA